MAAGGAIAAAAHGGTLAVDDVLRGNSACVENGVLNTRRAVLSWRQPPTNSRAATLLWRRSPAAIRQTARAHHTETEPAA